MSTVIPFPARRRPAGRIEVRATLEAVLEKTLDAVDHLVARLDELDGDVDLEEAGDTEPGLTTHSCAKNEQHLHKIPAGQD